MSEREELAAVLEGPYAAGVYAQDGRRISTAGRFLTQSDAESAAGIVLASPWLRDLLDKTRAEALAPVLALADEWENDTGPTPMEHMLPEDFASDLRGAAGPARTTEERS